MNQLDRSNNYKTICNKNNMYLSKNDNNNYDLKFESISKNICKEQILSFEFFNLLFKLNSESIKIFKPIESISENKKIYLIIFNPIIKDFGMNEKYLLLSTELLKDNNKIIFKSSSIDYENDEIFKQYNINKKNKISCSDSLMKVSLIESKLILNYNFNFDINEELPIFLENIMGLLIKKIFFNLKIFIDSL